MTTNVRFARPKDPADRSWRLYRFREPIAELLGVEIRTETPEDTVGLGTWTTPGDSMAGEALAYETTRLMPDKLSVAIFHYGGVPGQTYSIRLGVVTEDGSTLYRSAILNITGL